LPVVRPHFITFACCSAPLHHICLLFPNIIVNTLAIYVTLSVCSELSLGVQSSKYLDISQYSAFQLVHRLCISTTVPTLTSTLCISITHATLYHSVLTFLFLKRYFLNLTPNVALKVHSITTPMYYLPFPGEYLYRKCLTLCAIVR